MSESSECERPQIIDATASADARHTVRSIAGEAVERREGMVTSHVEVRVECVCGSEVRIGTIQTTVICQECRTEWRLQ